MKLIFGFFLFFLCTGVFAQPAYLLHKPYAVQFRYIDSIWAATEGPAKGIAIADDLKKWSDARGDKSFAEQFKLISTKWESINDHSAAMESKIISLVQECRSGNVYLTVDALELLANYQCGIGKYAAAFEAYLEAYNLYSGFSAKEFPNKQQYLYDMASAYSRYGDYDNALKYFYKALQTEQYNSDYIYPIENSIGMCYRRTGKYDSADKYFRIIYEGALNERNKVWEGIAGGNIGINYFLQGRYDEAVPLIQKDIELSQATGNISNAANSMNVLSHIYLAQKKYKEAEELTTHALSLMESKPFWPEYKLAEALYSELFEVYKARGNIQKAVLYADSEMAAKDSVSARFNSLAIQKAEEKANYVQHKMELQQLDNEMNMQVLVRNSLIVAILLLMVIALLFINRQRLQRKKLEAEKKNAEYDLEMASSHLHNFKQSIQEKNNIVEQFAYELEKYKIIEKDNADDEVLIKLQQSTILTDEQWENFRMLFEKVHKGFFKRVKDKMPDLTPAEIRFIALSKLKLSPKEMASMLGISPNSIRNYRLRFRRKLGLDEEASIEDIADAI